MNNMTNTRAIVDVASYKAARAASFNDPTRCYGEPWFVVLPEPVRELSPAAQIARLYAEGRGMAVSYRPSEDSIEAWRAGYLATYTKGGRKIRVLTDAGILAALGL